MAWGKSGKSSDDKNRAKVEKTVKKDQKRRDSGDKQSGVAAERRDEKRRDGWG